MLSWSDYRRRSLPWRVRGVGRLVGVLIAMSLAVPAVSRAAEDDLHHHDQQGAAMILQVKPAVVGIITEVSAEVTIRCGKGDTYVVKPEPTRENGTGFLIHPDGWIATNGHVVEPFYTADENHVADFLEAAADAAAEPPWPSCPRASGRRDVAPSSRTRRT